MSRILIAEDEPRISAFVEKGLTANGFTVTVVADGLSAFDYAVTGGFDLLVLDIGLPGMDGFAVLRKCSQNNIVRFGVPDLSSCAVAVASDHHNRWPAP